MTKLRKPKAVDLGIPRMPIFADAARPDVGQVVALVDKLNQAFDAFKVQNDKEIADIKAGKPDVVTREHTDRINASVTELSGQITALQEKIAANAVTGGTASNGGTPEARAHATAFRGFMRRGVDGDLRDLEIKAALSTDSNPDGGYVVPVETDRMISRVLATVSAMRRLAQVQPIGTNTLRKQHNLAGTGSGWVGEQDARSDSANPMLAQLEFSVMEMYAQPQATQAMLDDAFINTEEWLAGEVQTAFSELESTALISGDGNKKPRGILSYTKVANSSYSASTAANWAKTGYVVSGASGAFETSSATVNGYDRMLDLYHALREALRANATWLMADGTLATVRKIKDAQGQYIYMPPTATEPGSVLGKPIAIDDNMPAIAANSYSIAFADFRRAYLVLDRFGTRVLRDPFTNKPFVRFYTTKRVGGGMQDFEALKLMKFATS